MTRAARSLHRIGALAGALLAAGALSAGAAQAALPATSLYDTPSPSCAFPAGESIDIHCGPWTVPGDPSIPSSFTQCVYWAMEMRPDVFANRSPSDTSADWDAWTWVTHAQEEGLPITASPQAGDLVVWARGQGGADAGSGHIAFVQAVNSDRSITISEMNSYFAGNVGDYAVLPDANADNGGWQGLQFIGQAAPVMAPTPFPYTPPSASTPVSHASAPPTRAHPMQTGAPRLLLGGHSVQLILDLAPGSGTVSARARSGRHVVHLRARRSPQGRVSFSARLHSGTWVITLTYAPAKGFSAPAHPNLTLTLG